MSTAADGRPAALPAASARTLVSLLVAGAFATIAFDLFGQTISPLLGAVPTLGPKLAPAPLANQSVSTIFGVEGQTLSQLGVGHGLHVLTGLLAYPVGWAFIVRPPTRGLPWLPVAIVYGVALWVFALYVMAHLVAGNPPFLGWSGVTWVALWGHILFAVVAAAVWRVREERADRLRT